MKRRRILLINPWVYDFAAYDLWSKPLGLLQLGSLLKRAGCDVEMIDCMERGAAMGKGDGTGKYFKTDLPKPDVLRFVPRRYGRYGIAMEAFESELARWAAADAVCVTSSMTYWYPGVAEAVSAVRRKAPGVPVILGGRYATLCEAHARENVGADAVFTGALDEWFGEMFESAAGARVEIPERFEDFPSPQHALLKGDAAAVAMSRGCPKRCTYCASHRLAPRFEQRRARDVMDELDRLAERGVRHVAFYDDALLENSEGLIEPVLRHVMERGNPFVFHTPNALSAARVTPGLARLMADAGFGEIRIGFESATEKFQGETGGKVDNEQFAYAAEMFRAAGFAPSRIGAYVMCGHPMQEERDVMESIRFVASCGVTPYLADYSPIPGSADFGSAVATFRRNPEFEPLLQNPSIIQWQHPTIDSDAYRRLKLARKAAGADVRVG